MAEDMDRFLRSSVHCERYRTQIGIVKEVYSPSLIVVEGTQARFVYQTRFGPLFGAKKEVFDYHSWLT